VVENKIKIMKYRSLARRVMLAETAQRINALAAALEQKLHEMAVVTPLSSQVQPKPPSSILNCST
jgi:hypothetical protein